MCRLLHCTLCPQTWFKHTGGLQRAPRQPLNRLCYNGDALLLAGSLKGHVGCCCVFSYCLQADRVNRVEYDALAGPEFKYGAMDR